jgi:hypothetical protein
MANDKPKDPAEGRFAEAMRKSKEKRAGMQRQPDRSPKLEEEAHEAEVKSNLGEPS